MTAPAAASPKNSTPQKGKASPDKKVTPVKLELGKGPGPIDNKSIQEKIRKWQNQGAAVVAVPDALADVDENAAVGEGEEKGEGSGNASPAKSEGKEAGGRKATPKAQRKTQAAKGNDLDEDLKQAIAPKKRVVSDGHWRKNRSPPKDARPTGWVRPAKKVPSKKEEAEGKEADKPEPEPPKKSPRPKSPPKVTRAPDGTPVYAVRRRRKSDQTQSSNDDKDVPRPEPRILSWFNKQDNGSQESVSVDADDVSRRRSRRPKSDLSGDYRSNPTTERTRSDVEERRARAQSLGRSPGHGGISEDELRRRRRRRKTIHSREAADSPRPEAPEDNRPAERRKSRRRHHGHSSPDQDDVPRPEPRVQTSVKRKDDTATPPPGPETPPRVSGNRVDAWLSGTSDPFVDGKDKDRRKSLRRSSSSTEESSLLSEERRADHAREHADRDADRTSPKHGSRRRRRRRSHESEDDRRARDDKSKSPVSARDDERLITVEYDDSTIVSGTSTPPLRRRGATKSTSSESRPVRVKSSPIPETIPEDDTVISSTASSSVDASAADFPDVTPRGSSKYQPPRRQFPSTGKKLSTIASVETFDPKQLGAVKSRTLSGGSDQTVGPDDTPLQGSDSHAQSKSAKPTDAESITTAKGRGNSVRSVNRRRLASHADLISVLSMPKEEGKSIVSARSIRTNRSRLAPATMDDLMKELASDETRYMRELRTLVDGVIPVLLSCVLSKSDSAVAAGLFSRSSKDDPHITKPIVDMGVALERLKSLHKRIPLQGSDQLLSWGQSAQRVYADYVKAWRLGFQDVVVNLAPASGDSATGKSATGPDASSLDEGMPRNEEGYVVNGEGERVDVAFLLKRPLVRLKYMSKTFKGINMLKPSDRAGDMATRYQELVNDARKRSNEERARLEDEAAANIDPTRARDPKSLAPVSGVVIDPFRCVHARDYFDMHLPHSSGQVVDCRVELLLRDDPPDRGDGGDLLLCEVDNTGRWLLFPPIQVNRVSARNGDLQGEIVVMIRGYKSDGEEWQELMTLRSADEEAGFEWVQMLGLTPIPPMLSRKQSFSYKQPQQAPSSHDSSSLLSVGTASTPPMKSRTPSPREIEVPIGERANLSSSKWASETPERMKGAASPDTSPSTPPSGERNRLRKKYPPGPLSPTYTENTDYYQTTPKNLTEAMGMSSSSSPSGLRRSRAKRYSRDETRAPRSPRSPLSPRDSYFDRTPVTPERQTSRQSIDRSEDSYMSTSSLSEERGKDYSVWYPPSEAEDASLSDEDTPKMTRKLSERPQAHRRTSSVPAMDLPSLPKLRKSSQLETPKAEQRADSAPMPAPSTAPAKLQKKRPEALETKEIAEEALPPPTPPHRSASPVQLNQLATPTLTPMQPGWKTHRRSSSPLKHEYQPSTCTESSGDSEDSFSDGSGSYSSESSDEGIEADEAPTSITSVDESAKFPKRSPSASTYSGRTDTITPSQSASQMPYRTVPHINTTPIKTVASMFSWSDKGSWEALQAEECVIVITPGLIEAFRAPSRAGSESTGSQTEASMSATAERPLVALELTPLVPLRRGTALDISIRSPPTANSTLKTSSANIMFRSRTPDDCENLYARINYARINNPTYLALQQARGTHVDNSWAAAMDRRNAERTSGINAAGSSGGGSSWWNFGGGLHRRSSYRAKSTRALSTSAGTISSVGTMQSAFSALKRFSTRGGVFNSDHNNRGSMESSTYGSRSRSTDSLNGEAETSTGTDGMPMPIGITNSKIRLYVRETPSKWRDLGSARLSIMRPSRPSSPNVPSGNSGGNGSSPGLDAGPGLFVRHGQGGPGTLRAGQEKRIVVVGKKAAARLLDVTLNESCFERVARTGIAVSVWEDGFGTDGVLGGVAAVGGVSGVGVRVYMIQMKTERECAYCFSLLGKLRY